MQLQIRNKIEALQPKFSELNISEETFKKEVSFAMQKLADNPTLANATETSILAAVYNLALTGLTLNPAMSWAYLVPRKKKKGDAKPVCVLDISYRGLIKLAMDSGGIKSVYASVVYKNDHFIEHGGTNPFIDHMPVRLGENKGAKVGVYCVATLPDGSKIGHVLDREHIENIKKKSQYTGTGSAWSDFESDMWIKSCIKHARKYWPHSDKLAKAVNILDENDDFEPARSLKPVVPMPQPIIPPLEIPETFETHKQIEPQEPEEPAEDQKDDSDKLFMEISAWEGQLGKKFEKEVLVHFPKKKKWPKDFKVEDLSTVLKICLAVDEKERKKVNA